ncbi:hypothetical protein EDD86DRAFT_235366 [Gorgonomyces haynaldii]|nr:hypothetical protein EDD86DRAFT_235366 [Gorgonomyces haynaldii]
MNSFARLSNRKLLRVSGQDATKLLQGLVTNQIERIQNGGDGLLACFLTPQGRILFDSFIYPERDVLESKNTPSYLIDVNQDLFQTARDHLTKYKLRSKLVIEPVDKYIIQQWGPKTERLSGSVVQETHLPHGSIIPRDKFYHIGCKDPRHPSLGIRFVDDKLPTSFSEQPLDVYERMRVSLGIAEGTELVNGLPLESNLDLMNGVDFRKGCYLGQELTIRTYHTGVTRKRIVPLELDGPTAETELLFEGKKAGKILKTIDNIGLGLVRLEYLSTLDKPVHLLAGSTQVKAYAPTWWPQAP